MRFNVDFTKELQGGDYGTYGLDGGGSDDCGGIYF